MHRDKTNVKEINNVILIDSDNLVVKTLLEEITEQNMDFKIRGNRTVGTYS